MKIILPGGSGQIGTLLQFRFVKEGHDVVVLGREHGSNVPGARAVIWDAKTLGPWTDEIDGADVVINLAGRSVSTRYTEENLAAMMNSRVDSARVIGEAIAKASSPPKVWLQMSTATIYADTRNGTNNEATGVIGGNEANVPDCWEFSVRIAKNWEAAMMEAELPNTRRVALRAAMVMTPDQGGIFDVLSMMSRVGLGGAIAGGKQKISWIHGDDFVRGVQFLMNSDAVSGPVNFAAPGPLAQKDFMRILRKTWGMPVGLPATKLMASVGSWALRTDPELLLKSRSVVPGTLVENGFEFNFPTWEIAAPELVARAKTRPAGISLGKTAKALIKLGRG